MATNGTQAVDRAALLVSTVIQAGEPLSFADLQEACDLPKSTTSRMLTALERSELLERTMDGSYVAGGLFWLYAARHDPGEDLVRLAGPTLEAISEATHETVNLSMARGERVVQVAQVDSQFLLGTRDWTQVDVPAHCSSLGKVFLAWDAVDLPPGRWRHRPRRASPTRPRCAPTSSASAAGAAPSPSTSSRSGSPVSPCPFAAPATRWSRHWASRDRRNDWRTGSTNWAGC